MKLLKMMQEKEKFSPTEWLIVKYLLENYRELPELSARQLAEKTYTSSAAVVRFCQKLGLKGYAEFKVRFLAEAMQGVGQAGKKSITNKDTILSIIDKVTKIEMDALQETRNDTKPAAIVRTVHFLEQAAHIDFYALDNNLHIADLARYSFLHAGKLSTVHHQGNAQYLQAITAPKDHIAFFISRTGENRRLVEIAELLQERKCKMLLLTAVQESTLSRLASETLCVATENQFNELGNFVFLVGAKYMIDILFSVLLARHYDTSLQRNEFYEKFFSNSN